VVGPVIVGVGFGTEETVVLVEAVQPLRVTVTE
jgi:hypothetical protein